jgi:hypothetical protein
VVSVLTLPSKGLVLVHPDGSIGLTGGSFDPEPIIDSLHTITGQ